LCVAHTCVWQVFFFNVDDYNGSEPLEESDAVGTVQMSAVNADEPMYLSRGENPDEILITTFDKKVVRMCVPTTGCTSNSLVMVKYGLDYAMGIARLDKTFLVADRKNTGQGKIYECSLTWAYNTGIEDCDVFAYKPEGAFWDPYNIEVDTEKRLVYVADRTYNAVHSFAFSGDYMGHLTKLMGALLGPTAMALRAGPLPSLSSITPATSLTAGTPFQTALALRTHDNELLPNEYPVEDELYRYQVRTRERRPMRQRAKRERVAKHTDQNAAA